MRTLLAADRWEEALALARQLAAQQPADADLAAALAETLYRAGSVEDAATVAAPLLQAEAPPPRAMMVAGLVQAASGLDSEGARWLDRAARAAPDDPEILFRAADNAVDPARAVALLQAFLEHGGSGDPDRIESAKGSLAFQKALGERQVWIVKERPERARYKLRPMGERGATSGFLVEASFGEGKPVALLLDTGSTGLFVVDRVAKRHGFAELAVETTFGGGSSERHRTRRGVLPSFALGSLRFADVLATVSEAEVDPTGRYAGILGLQPFAGYRVTLDLVAGALELDPLQEGERTSGEPYWNVSGQMLVRARAAGGPAGLFLFDTGASRSVVSHRFAKQTAGASSSGKASVRGYGGDVEGARTVRGVTLGLHGVQGSGGPLAAVDFDLRSRMGGTEVSGFAGLDLLAGQRWVIDPERQVLWRIPAERERAKAPK